MQRKSHPKSILSSCAIELLIGPADPRRSTAVKDHKRRLKSNIAEDIDTQSTAALDSSEASGAGSRDLSVVDVSWGDGELAASDAKGEAGDGRAAGEGVAAVVAVVGGPGDLSVVGRHDGAGQVQESSAGVGDVCDRGCDPFAGSN